MLIGPMPQISITLVYLSPRNIPALVIQWIKIAQFNPLDLSFAMPSKALHTLDILLLLSDESFSSDSGLSLLSDGSGSEFGGCGSGRNGDLQGNGAEGGADSNLGSEELNLIVD